MTLGPVTRWSGADASVPRLACCVHQAFEAYNGWQWTMGDHAGAECSLWLLQRQITAIMSNPGAVAYVIPMACDGDTVGVAAVAFLIRCPSASPPPPPSLLERARLAWNLGPSIASRLSAFNNAVAKMHEHDAATEGEHFKISFVAVLPHMQGRGLASQVMRRVLADVDAERLPCYLFTANDANEQMYAKRGFGTRSRQSMGVNVAGVYAGEEMVIRSMLRPRCGSS